MDRTYWHRQTPDKPLFPELVWSRPENKRTAGKLLIIGGSAHGFAAPAEAYQEAGTAGIGSIRVVLPAPLKSTAGLLIDTVDYAPATPSGSFAKSSLSVMLDSAAWADGILVAGDLGRNSETAVVLESLLDESSLPTVVTKDAIEYITSEPEPILKHQNVVLVLSLSQLQRLFSATKQTTAISLSMDLLHLVDILHDFTKQFPIGVITRHLDQTFVAIGGRVSTTPSKDDKEDLWRVKTAAHASVWLIQNPAKPFEALTASIPTIV